MASFTKQTKLSAFFKTSSTPLRQVTSNTNNTSGNAIMGKRKTTSPSKTSPKKVKEDVEDGGLNPSKSSKTSSSSVSERLAALEKSSQGVVVNFGASWLPALEKEFEKPEFKQLCDFVVKERAKSTVYPKACDVFTWTEACKLSEVKAVILGQDPYPGPNQAHGLCFSVLPDVVIPGSLRNMYKELVNDIPGFVSPGHGYLMGWARQGVLLLNAVLTVKAGAANSHKDKGWEKITDAVIKHLNDNCKNLVFILWGNYAQKKGAHIDKKKHCVLKGVHPSPLSAERGFYGCKHFSRANQYLVEHGKKPINWSDLPSK